MKLKEIIRTVVIGVVLGVGGGVLVGELEVATIKAEITAADGLILSLKAELLIRAIDNVIAYRADPDSHILTYTDVEIMVEWLEHGILQ